MKKRLLWALAALFAVALAAPFILYLLLPKAIGPYLQGKLASFGCEDARVAVDEVATNGASIEEIYCLLPKRGEFRLREIDISYALSELYSGGLGKVLVKKAEVSIFPGEQENKPSIPALPETFFAFVPLSELEISRIELLYPGNKETMKVEADLRARFHALTIEGELRASSASPELQLKAGFALSSAQANLLLEEGRFSSPGLRVSVPGNSQLSLKKESNGLAIELSKEVAVSATANKIKHEARLKGIKARIREKEARAEFQIAYRELPWVSMAVRWQPEKEEAGFSLKSVILPLAKVLPIAMEFMPGKKPPLDVLAGELAISAEGKAGVGKNPALLSANAKGELKGLGGTYGEYKFEGVHFPIQAEFQNGAITLSPADLRIDGFNPGVPVKNIKAKASIERKGGEMGILLAAASAEVFSGQVLVPDLSFSPGRPSSKFQVELKALSLSEVIALQKQEGISGSGIIDGMLPIELGKAGIVVKNGTLRARPPGGYIAYEAGEGLRAAAEGNPGLKLAVDVLRNFQYQVLEGKVDYQVSGDMDIALRLEGHNPEWSGGRPVHFNFTVSENIPKLLKSLRIADDTENALEKRMRGQ